MKATATDVTAADLSNLPPTLTLRQAAGLLGISHGSIYAAHRRGEIPSLRIGNRIIVPTVKLLALLGVEPTA